MISFEVDPLGYYVIIAFGLVSLLLAILFFADKTEQKSLWGIFLATFIFVILILSLMFIYGTVSTEKITVCSHTLFNSGYMEILDTNYNLYYTSVPLNRYKIKDNSTIIVKVANSFVRNNYIYSIDAPITCGNQTCGVSPT